MGSSRGLTCAGCKVAGSHHPRALSGRGEKPIRGSEERELSTQISPPEPRLPVQSYSSSLRPPSTAIQGCYLQSKGGGVAGYDVLMVDESLASPYKQFV